MLNVPTIAQYDPETGRVYVTDAQTGQELIRVYGLPTHLIPTFIDVRYNGTTRKHIIGLLTRTITAEDLA